MGDGMKHDNPPKAEMPCQGYGCPTVTLCPLHAKAPEMLELVRRLAYGSNRPFDHPDARAMHKAGIVALALLQEIE